MNRNRLRLSRAWTTFLFVTLLTGAACTTRRDFNRAEQEDTLQAFETFLEKHPGKKAYAPRAKARLEILAFEQARRKDTYTGYIDYLNRFPFGTYSRLAAGRAEDLRAEELDIHLYRTLPGDYYEQVSPRELPYRILVRSSDPAGMDSEHLERKWVDELKRRDLLGPMDPREASVVSPDLTLYVRESVVRLCRVPRALVQAELWVDNQRVQEYRVAGDRIEQLLLYEIFLDRGLYDSFFRIPDKERTELENRFDALQATLPLRESIALEFDLRQDSWHWDREVTLAYAEFLRGLPLCNDFTAYARGKPPDRAYKKRIFFRVDPETHSPSLRRQWSTSGPSTTWRAWNAKWILRDRDHFFKKMTLELLELSDSPRPAPSPKRRPVRSDPIQWP